MDMEVQVGNYSKEYYLDWMFYTVNIGDGQLSQHRINSFGYITLLYSSESYIFLNSIFPVGFKYNCILRGI